MAFPHTCKGFCNSLYQDDSPIQDGVSECSGAFHRLCPSELLFHRVDRLPLQEFLLPGRFLVLLLQRNQLRFVPVNVCNGLSQRSVHGTKLVNLDLGLGLVLGLYVRGQRRGGGKGVSEVNEVDSTMRKLRQQDGERCCRAWETANSVQEGMSTHARVRVKER